MRRDRAPERPEYLQHPLPFLDRIVDQAQSCRQRRHCWRARRPCRGRTAFDRLGDDRRPGDVHDAPPPAPAAPDRLVERLRSRSQTRTVAPESSRRFTIARPTAAPPDDGRRPLKSLVHRIQGMAGRAGAQYGAGQRVPGSGALRRAHVGPTIASDRCRRVQRPRLHQPVTITLSGDNMILRRA
jgi:hypothetical protein